MKKNRTPRPGRQPSPTNNLLVRFPAVAAEYRLDGANGDLGPTDLLPYSTHVAAWRCQKCQHEWAGRVVDRTRKHRGCPRCAVEAAMANSLAARYPKVAAQFDPERNPPGVTPATLAWSSNRRIAWTCPEGPDHKWLASPNSRTADEARAGRGAGCPFCANQLVSVTNSLATVRPDLAAQLDPELNDGLMAHQITWTTTRRVVWRCPDGHVWPARVRDRTLQGGHCPFDTGHRLADDRTLAAAAPHLVAEWAQDLNGDRTPDNTAAYSDQPVWWRKPDAPNDVWSARPADRVRGKGSPFVHGHRPSQRNNLAAVQPELAAQWHERNGRSAAQVTAKSSYPAWWRCPRDAAHVWQATVKNRVHGTDCPFCDRSGESRAQHRVAWELRYCFPDIPGGRTRQAVARLPAPNRRRTRRYREVDILLPSLNVAIEFDGVRWHRDKADDDRRKTAELQAAGLRVLRLREKGLPLLTADDVAIGLDQGNRAPHLVAAAVVRKLLAWGYDVPRAHEYIALGKAVHAAEARQAWDRQPRGGRKRDE